METEPNTKKRWQAIIEFTTEDSAGDHDVTAALGQAANALRGALRECGADEVTLRSTGELRPLRIPAMAGGGVNDSYGTPGG